MDTADQSIQSRQVECVGLSIHLLECGQPGNDLILLLHGFPELAFSWRKVMPMLARAGHHVIAPDMRGYGKTISLEDPHKRVTYQDSLLGFGMIDTIAEMTALVQVIYAKTHGDGVSARVKLVVGHDMGSAVAANLALARPDMFSSLIMMSAPYTGPPSLSPADGAAQARVSTLQSLASLDPPRKHYQLFFCQPDANDDLCHASQGLAAFYRGYYYYKSALWHENKPRKLGNVWTLDGIAQLPEYYIMQKEKSMSQTVADAVQDTDLTSQMPWMTRQELMYYVETFERTGFQGGLNHYRARITGQDARQTALFSGRRIEVPCAFISGAADWGNCQDPGGLERMASDKVVQQGMFKGCTFVPGAGHWVQQEQPQGTVDAILKFLKEHAQ